MPNPSDPSPVLVIGNKNYSSWSMRPWLACLHFELPIGEDVIFLDKPDTQARIRRHSPAGKVPILRDGALTVWDSLAILEALAERHPDRAFWPAERERRARARALAAEMHAGFAPLRQQLPMDCRARHAARTWPAEVEADIARIDEIFAAAEGPFLFGDFGAVDCMFAPVVSRCVTYAVALSDPAARYRDAVTQLPAYRRWQQEAADEPDELDLENR